MMGVTRYVPSCRTSYSLPSPHAVHTHPSGSGARGRLTLGVAPESAPGRTPMHAAHWSASASLTSVQRGHAHSASGGTALANGRALARSELVRVGGGVVGRVRGREGGRESERGFGSVGWAPPAPRGTRRTVGRGVRMEEAEEGVVEPLMVESEDEEDELDD